MSFVNIVIVIYVVGKLTESLQVFINLPKNMTIPSAAFSILQDNAMSV
jgi:hypothetical protein